jgi:hypothetical protein
MDFLRCTLYVADPGYCDRRLSKDAHIDSDITRPSIRSSLYNYLQASLPASGTPMNMIVAGDIVVVPAVLEVPLEHWQRVIRPQYKLHAI